MYLEHVVNRLGSQMKSILDPSFRYVDSTNTDIRRTFARVRCEQREQVAALDRTAAVSQEAMPRRNLCNRRFFAGAPRAEAD